MGRGLSITAFVLAFLMPLVGLILGIIAYKKVKEDPEGLRGLAIAAIIIGGIFTLMVIVGIIFVAFVWGQISGPIYDHANSNNFQISAPLVANFAVFDPVTDSIFFVFRNGLGEQITIDQITVSACSDVPLEIVAQSMATIPPGEEILLFYGSDEDCIKKGERFTSDISFRFLKESGTIQETVMGYLSGTPLDFDETLLEDFLS